MYSLVSRRAKSVYTRGVAAMKNAAMRFNGYKSAMAVSDKARLAKWRPSLPKDTELRSFEPKCKGPVRLLARRMTRRVVCLKDQGPQSV